MTTPVIEVRGLDFRYRPDAPLVLRDVELTMTAGMRCLLIGANGAGKTTLLRVLAGKHLIDPERVRVLGRPAFHDTTLAGQVELLSGNFAFDVDVRVGDVIGGVREVDPERRDLLVDMLGVDFDWHMHRISDGQRRRVQILLGLLRPKQVLLLDEITTDLDLVARDELLGFLRRASETDGTAIVYATHILGSLESWASHLAYLDRGRLISMEPIDQIAELAELRAAGELSPLHQMVRRWLRRDAPRR